MPDPAANRQVVARILESRRGVRRLALGGVCLLVAAAPFEALDPWLQLPGQNLSSVETVMAGVLALWMAGLAVSREAAVWRTPLTAPWIAVAAAGLLAAIAAPADRGNALHMVGRFILAFAVFVLAVNAAVDRGAYRAIGVAFLLSGVAVSVLMIGEYAGRPAVLEALKPFRLGVSVVGSQVRASGPFQYPTIASMFLEIAFAVGVGLFVDALDRRRRGSALLVALALVVIAEGVVVSFTRAGLITLTLTLLGAGAFCWLRKGFGFSTRAVAAVALTFAVQVGTSRNAEAMRLRMTTEGQNRWYQATIQAPSSLSLDTGRVGEIPIRLRNAGRLAWDPFAAQPVRVSYHWIESGTDRVVTWEGIRTELPGVIPPGHELTLGVKVRAPGEAGQYRLVWDLEVVDRLWFSTEPDAALAATETLVSGPPVAMPSGGGGPASMPRALSRPGRSVLWRAGASLLAGHPLLGIGPDNFRLHYGPAAGIANADDRVHSNNTYLEILVGSGIAGGAALLWLAVAVAGLVRTALGRDEGLAIGAAAAMAAIAVHGLVDSFLGFTGTYVAMAVVSALLVNVSRLTERYADRV